MQAILQHEVRLSATISFSYEDEWVVESLQTLFFPHGANMKLIKLMVIVFAIGLSANSNAAKDRNAVTSTNTVRYLGVFSCGQWTDARAGKEAEGKDSIGMELWMLGFLSGVAGGSGINILEGSKRNALLLWMDTYCSKNPVENVDEGAVVLARKLINEKKK